jgi:hypothetical protein
MLLAGHCRFGCYRPPEIGGGMSIRHRCKRRGGGAVLLLLLILLTEWLLGLVD